MCSKLTIYIKNKPGNILPFYIFNIFHEITILCITTNVDANF